MPIAQPLATKEPYGCGCSCRGAQNLCAALAAASTFDRCHSFLLAASATGSARKRPPLAGTSRRLQAFPILFVGRDANIPPLAGTHNNGQPADIDKRPINNLTVDPSASA